MIPYYKTDLGMLYLGDSREVLLQLDRNSVDMIITSPPYWALRDYGIENQLGQERNFEHYLFNLVEIFDISYPVIKDSGSLWANVGDTYYSKSKGTGGKTTKQLTNSGSYFKNKIFNTNLIEKSLCLIPSRFAIKMQDSGWILRNDIIWHKPNQYPTSAKDRFTHDYEHLFFFTKNKKYYFNQQFEPYTEAINRWGGELLEANGTSEWDVGTGQMSYRKRLLRPNPKGRNKRSIWTINTKHTKGLKHFATFPEELIETPIAASCPRNGIVMDIFIGSGTTALYCEKNNIRWIGIEINEDYCNTVVERLKKL